MRLLPRQMQQPEEQERVVDVFRLRQLRTPTANPPLPQIFSSPQILQLPIIPPTPGNFWNMMTVEH